MALGVRGLFGKRREIANIIRSRTEDSMDDRLYRALKRRIEKTNGFMNFRPTSNEYKGKYGFFAPIYYTGVQNQKAVYKQAFRNDPVSTVINTEGTPSVAARSMQMVLAWNHYITRARHRAYYLAFDDVAQFGTAILKERYRIWTQWRNEFVPNEIGGVDVQKIPVVGENSFTERVNPLNYYQDFRAIGNHPVFDNCHYLGELMYVDVAQLIGMRDWPNVDKEKIGELIERAKSQKQSEIHPDHTPDAGGINSKEETGRVVLNVQYGRFPAEGNEDNPEWFRIVLSDTVSDIIQIVPVFGRHPYTLMRSIPRKDAYTGRGPIEPVGSFQLLANIMGNKGVENVINNMQRYVFYMKDAIQKGDLQNPQNNGLIPMDFKQHDIQQISQAIQQYQGSDTNIGAMQAFLAMFNDFIQRATAQSDLYTFGVKPSVGGGLNPGGQTATGAQQVQNNLQMRISAEIDELSINIQDSTDVKMQLLQENLPDPLMIQLGAEPIEVRRMDIAGHFTNRTRSSLTTNNIVRAQEMQNLIVFLTNLSANPVAAQQISDINWRVMAREVMELNKIPNRDTILPEQPTQQQPVPGPGQAPAPGQPGGIPQELAQVLGG